MSTRKLTEQQKARREIVSVSTDDIYAHQLWMFRALELAKRAADAGEIPVGAVIVFKGKIIGEGANSRQTLQDPTTHAEIQAIRQACRQRGSWNLSDCWLYVTLEPCCMCSGAILQARIPFVVYGARDPKAGAVDSLFQLLSDKRLNHRCQIIGGILDTACAQVLSDFFQSRR